MATRDYQFKMKTITRADLDPALLAAMEKEKIDVGLTLSILNNYNSGRYHYPQHEKFSIPEIDGSFILDLSADPSFTFSKSEVKKHFQEIGLDLDPGTHALVKGDSLVFSKDALAAVGIELLPFTAYGVLNGGSASSYIDYKKNRAFNESLFRLYASEFFLVEKLSHNQPKGITPAFLNRDGTPGPSFLELKLRSLLLFAYRYCLTKGKQSGVCFPFFQMTSVLNDRVIKDSIEKFRESPLLSGLVKATGFSFDSILTGIQPLLAAVTHSHAGKQKAVFSQAFGKENTPLPMPGGHGQNFYVLKDIYRGLYERGIRFAWLGNVDNLGYTIDPVSLALIALHGSSAAFEFSFRTPIDVKGGILVRHASGRLDCRDIGTAISGYKVFTSEKAGKKTLFNCAIGLFNLAYLDKNINRIIKELPVRFSDQDKKAGEYSQAEQITWEVLGLVESPLVLGVDKYSRFLAVKVLLEGLMTSGLKLDDPGFPTDADESRDLKRLAQKLHAGLATKLQSVYGMKELNGRWVPKTLAEIEKEYGKP